MVELHASTIYLAISTPTTTEQEYSSNIQEWPNSMTINRLLKLKLNYSSGIVIAPSSISFAISTGDFPLTVQPMEWHDPRISFTVPTSFFAIDLDRIILEIFITASSVTFPECLIFLTFFLSRGGSLSSFNIKADAVGTTVGVAWIQIWRKICN